MSEPLAFPALIGKVQLIELNILRRFASNNIITAKTENVI